MSKGYRTKLQACTKKMNDIVKDIELLTMSIAISDEDRDIFISAFDQQSRKLKAALRNEPTGIELQWPDEKKESEKTIEKQHDKPTSKDGTPGML